MLPRSRQGVKSTEDGTRPTKRAKLEEKETPDAAQLRVSYLTRTHYWGLYFYAAHTMHFLVCVTI